MGRGPRTALSIAWATLPLVTLGMATPLVFVFAAARVRTVFNWLAAVVYSLAFVGLLATAGSRSGSAENIVFSAALVVSWLGATAHAFAIRSRVFARSGTGQVDTGRFADAIAVAEYRKDVREEARKVARDPAMAWDLHIGRPDLPRAYDDGGLIDVNHAPPQVLASLPGMTPDLVNRILRAREKCGGFSSVEELSVLADLPPAITPQLGEFAIFLP